MTVTSTDIVNEAIQRIGNNQPLVSGTAPTFDQSPSGRAAAILYAPIVQSVGRRFEWDMARNTVSLTLSGGAAPVGWTYEYLYPSNGIEVWQLLPATFTDANNPLPINWVVANATISAVQKKVIHTDLVSARAVYNNNPGETLWDPLFREAVVAALANAFAIALAGKPDTAQAMFDMGNFIEGLAQGRDS
jgi:hypothetical protein